MKTSMIIHPEELSRTWIDKLAAAGIDKLGIHPVGGAGTAAKSLAALVEQMQTEDYRSLIDYARACGLAVEYEMHAAEYLMPTELFSEHPEYFRMNAAGERTPFCNFCVSEPHALALFAERAAALADALYGSEENYYFWMDDGYDLHCHCPKCRALSPSDQQLCALNAMLREIKKKRPHARMAYLAYMDCILPPVSVAPEEGIFLEYAPFEKYTAKGEDAPERIAREREMLAKLTAFFKNEPTKVLEYWYDNSLLSGWKKPPRPFVLEKERMEAEIVDYRRLGFEEIASFACFLGEDYRALYGEVDILPFARATEPKDGGAGERR